MNFLIKIYETHKQDLNNKIVSLARTLPVYIEFRIGKVFLLIMKTYKTKLKLNNKQRTQLFRNAGVARFAYNLTLEIEENNYKSGNQFLSDFDVRKLITKRKQDDLVWLYDYDCDIVKQAVKDAVKAYKTFFKNKKGTKQENCRNVGGFNKTKVFCIMAFCYEQYGSVFLQPLGATIFSLKGCKILTSCDWLQILSFFLHENANIFPFSLVYPK